MSLTVFNNDGLELVIDLTTGEAFATQAGYVRMSGKAKSTISERVEKGVREELIKEAELLTTGGLQGVRLIPAKLVFKWLIKDNPELAEKMGEAGATVYLYQLAGYEVKPALVSPPPLSTELDVINQCLLAAGLQPPLVAGVMLNHAEEKMPSLRSQATKEARALLARMTESPLLMTPTKIGKELGVSAIRVNRVLLDIGYQIKNLGKTSKTEPDYLVTDIGKPYANNTLATGDDQDSSTYQHLKWKPEVVGIIREHLAE